MKQTQQENGLLYENLKVHIKEVEKLKKQDHRNTKAIAQLENDLLKSKLRAERYKEYYLRTQEEKKYAEDQNR